MLKIKVTKGKDTGVVMAIREFPAVFGRGDECNYKITDSGISRAHFSIDYSGNDYLIRDLGSKNGTYCNGEPVHEHMVLSDSDSIMIANGVTLQVLLEEEIPGTSEKKVVSKRPIIDYIKPTVRRQINIEETSILGPIQEKLHHSYRALRSIYEVVQKCNEQADFDLLFECLLLSLFKAIQAERGAVVLKRGKNFHGMKFLVEGEKTEEFTISNTILKDVVENSVSVISYNTESDIRYKYSQSLRFQRVSSLICAPLISYQKVFGAVYLDRSQKNNKPFGEEELELLAAIGIQVGTSLEKSLLLKELQETLTEKEHLLDALTVSEERYALAAKGANDGLWDWNLKTNEIYFSPRWKAMLGYQDEELENHPDEWFKRIDKMDIEQVELDLENHLNGLSQNFESEHRVKHKDGTIRWFLVRGLVVRDENNKPFRMAGSQTDITERKRVEKQLLHDAFHDDLTHLPNRALFLDRIDGALRRVDHGETTFSAVIFIGIDRFKIINDSLGHHIGDQLLIAMAKRLQDCLRLKDTLARFTGDEFTILFENAQNIREVTRMAESIKNKLAIPFSIESHEIFATASIGIALATKEYKDSEELMRNAARAMYRAKELGRNRYEVFDKTLHEDALEMFQLETDMRRALDREEFKVYYQPIIEMKTGRISGFEALLRWWHPERGMISPADFIPLAEETGLIVPIGTWVINNACKQACLWHKITPQLSISVNLSAKQMEQELISEVGHALQATSLEPDKLKLELTETLIMDNTEVSLAILQKLKAMNVQLQIDDFGTGYSSLSYLQRFPVNSLKIDRSFVMRMLQDKDNLEIVRTILLLGRNLGMSVVAEGIEDAASFERLKQLLCDYGQGYFFAKPLNCDDATTLLKSSPSW